MLAEVEKIRKGQEFAESFVRARRQVVKRLLSQGSESMYMASRLTQNELLGLPPNADELLVKEVATLRPEEVVKIAAEELAPARMVIRGIGAKAKLEAMFADAGAGR